MKTIEITLPWPPTVNHYWQRNSNGGMRVSEKGIQYRDAVGKALQDENLNAGLANHVMVEIEAYMPDKRRRDLDNVLKALLDSLTHGGLWGDDDQVDDLRIYRARDDAGKLVIGGMVKVRVGTIQAEVA